MFSLINFSFEESVPWWSPVVVPVSPRWRVPWLYRRVRGGVFRGGSENPGCSLALSPPGVSL